MKRLTPEQYVDKVYGKRKDTVLKGAYDTVVEAIKGYQEHVAQSRYQVVREVLDEWMNLPTGPADENRMDEFEGWLEHEITKRVRE